VREKERDRERKCEAMTQTDDLINFRTMIQDKIDDVNKERFLP